MRTAANAEGRLLARDVECWFDTGAYADNGPRVTATGGDAAPGPYRWAAFRVDAACVYTNTAPSGSYRAFGATHLQWIGESQVDEVARRAGRRPARRPPPEPAHPGRGGALRRQAARRGPDRRRREGRSGGRLGRAEAAAAWVAASRSGCSPPVLIRSRAPSAASRRTAASSSSSARRRWGRGRARRSPRSPPRRSASSRIA